MSENENINIKLTDWEKEPSLIDLKKDYDGALQNRNSFLADITKWKHIKNTTGPYGPKQKDKNKSSTFHPKLARKQLEWRYPALSEPFLNTPKLFSVKPVTGEDEFSASQNELLLNYQFDNQINKVKFIDEFVRRNADEGLCIVKTYWERETKEIKKNIPIYEFTQIVDEEEINNFLGLVELKNKSYNEFLNLPLEAQEAINYFEENNIVTRAIQVGEQEVIEDEVIKNQPKLDIIDPNNAYIDPSCGSNYEDAKFIIISYETSKSELQKDGRFTNLDKINFNGSNLQNDPEHKVTADINGKSTSNFNFSDEARKKVICYEYWGYYDVDGSGELKPIVANWINNTLIRLEENPFPQGKLPFNICTYNPKFDTIYGESDIELLEDSQKTLGAVSRGIIDLLGKSANSQTGFARGFLTELDKRKYQAGEDYEFNTNISPQLGVYQHTFPETSQTSLAMLQLQNQEAESLTGIKTYDQGLSGGSLGNVATAVKGVLNAVSQRESSILRRLIHSITEIGKNIILMNNMFLSEEETIRITDKKFQKIRKEELKFNRTFDIKIDINIPEVDEKMVADLAFMLQTIGPNMGSGLLKIILSKIAKLRNMPDLEKLILEYEEPADPVQEQIKSLELQKIQLEVAELQSQVRLNEARALKEEAEAKTKIYNLEEEGLGIKHQKDLEKQKAQAEGNEKLEITKSILNKEISDDNIEAAEVYRQLNKD